MNHKYQQSPLYVYLGECVNFTAKSYFSTIERASANVKIVWKKDTQLLKKGGAWWVFNAVIIIRFGELAGSCSRLPHNSLARQGQAISVQVMSGQVISG